MKREASLWWSSPDWWVAIFTGLLMLATIFLGVFTYRLWKATAAAVADTQEGLTVARRTANAAQMQAEVSERVGMIQNISALDGHLRYLATCALLNTRSSDVGLSDIPGHLLGYGRVLRRLQMGAASDEETDKARARLLNPEVDWVSLLQSQHFLDFITSAEAVVHMAERADVLFLVDSRIIHIMALWPQTMKTINDLNRSSPRNSDPTLFLK